MSTAVLNPPVASPHSNGCAPLPLRWTADAFNTIGETGVFEGRRAFLVDGIILEQGPMNPPHAEALEQVDLAVRTAFGSGWRFRVQSPFDLSQYTNPMPDYAVVPQGPRGFHPKTAALIVEIADTSFFYDTTTKAELYATGGIADYWVLELETRTLHVFRDPAPIASNGHSYRTHMKLAATETVTPLATPNATIRVADLLP